jgi:N-acetylglucosamine-6-sulfatase
MLRLDSPTPGLRRDGRMRARLPGLLALSVALFAVPTRSAPAPPSRPNVIVIVTDDQRWDTLGYMPAVQRRLVAQGITFTNAFTTTPVCLPSRTSLLTGRYPHATGVLANFPPLGGPRRFVGPDASTLATWLHGAGYRTGMFGKYVNLYGSQQCPPATAACYRPPGWDEWHVFLDEEYFTYQLAENDTITSYGSAEGDYSTDVLAAKASEFIRTTRDQPFLLVLNFFAPHSTGPFPPTPAPRHRGTYAGLALTRPPSWDEDDVSDKPGWVQRRPRAGDLVGGGVFRAPAGDWYDDMRRGQLEALQAVDEGVEQLMAALDATGRAADTIVVFTSDNGFSWGEHRWLGKSCPYEECLRVPLVIRYPALRRAGRRARQMVLNIDLAPTLADLAGVDVPPGVDGRSLRPLLRGHAGPGRAAFLFEYFAIPQEVPPSFRGLRTRRWKLALWADPADDELLHFATDPFELESLPPDARRISRRLARRLERLDAARRSP